MQLFELVSPRLFRPLAGPNRAFYAELLLLLWEECRHTADYSISRAEAVSRAEDYFAALAKPLALDADDAGDEAEQPTRDPHTLALGFLLRLRRTGWLEEQPGSYEEEPALAFVPEVAPLLEALEEILNPRVVTYTGKLYKAWQLLQNVGEEKSPYENVLREVAGDLEALNDTAHEILARLVFDGNGGCEVWLAMYLEGENDFNFADTYARVVPDDDSGLELRGMFMGGEMQDGILSVDETGALYVSCEVDSDLVDGSISLLANLRHLDDENWTDDDFIPMPESAVEYYRGKTFMEIADTFEIDTSLIPDDGSGGSVITPVGGGGNGGLPENYPYERTTANGLGEYGKSNPDATGLADLPTMQKVRQELWDMGSSESSKLTYDDIKAMLGGEDGIPHTGMDEKSWNSEKHAYGWFNGEGDYYVLYFVVRDGDEYYTAATFSSSVRGDS